MTIDSPLTEYIIEPFDSYIESKNNLKYNKFALIQLSFMFLIISFYYYTENMTDKSGILYILAYFMFYKFIKSLKNVKGSKNKTSLENIKSICEITYFIINSFIIIYILDDGNYQLSTIVILLTILLLTYLSYAIKFNNYSDSNDNKLNDWKYILKTTCNTIYPSDDKTKKYHINKFWKVFDFSTLSFIIFLLINKNRS